MIPPDEEVEGKIPEEGSDDTIETEEPGQDEHVVSKVAHYIRVCLPFFFPPCALVKLLIFQTFTCLFARVYMHSVFI